MSTNIPVSDEVWKVLNVKKEPGESFDDVLRRELALDTTSDLPREVDDYLAELDLSAAERDAVEEMWRYVRDHGPVSPQEIRDDVHPGNEAGKKREWWWKALSPHLDDSPQVDRVSQRRYEFVG